MSENADRVSAIPPHLQTCGHSSTLPRGHAQQPAPAYCYWLDEGIEEFVFVQFGIQQRLDDAVKGKVEAGDDEIEQKITNWIAMMKESLKAGKILPDHWELGRFVDVAGCQNQLFTAYWSGVAAFESWKKKHGDNFWNETINPKDPIGVYEELFFVRPVDFETVYMRTDLIEGVANMPGAFSPSHIIQRGYVGAFRTRIPRAQDEDLKAINFPEVFERELEGNSKRVVIRGNGNLGVISSGQNFIEAGNEARMAYEESVMPTLQECEEDKQSDNMPDCYVNRFVTYDDENGVPVRTVSRSYWKDVHGLGEWTKTPIHAQLKSVFGTVFKAGHLPGFRLWHEVFAIGPKVGQAASRFEYIGCHDRTGLLDPYYKERFGPYDTDLAS